MSADLDIALPPLSGAAQQVYAEPYTPLWAPRIDLSYPAIVRREANLALAAEEQYRLWGREGLDHGDMLRAVGASSVMRALTRGYVLSELRAALRKLAAIHGVPG